MISAGTWQLRREAQHDPVGISAAQWAGIMVGAIVIGFSFAMDYRNLMAGGMPHPFDWSIFSAFDRPRELRLGSALNREPGKERGRSNSQR
jgi:hypothetical protein